MFQTLVKMKDEFYAKNGPKLSLKMVVKAAKKGHKNGEGKSMQKHVKKSHAVLWGRSGKYEPGAGGSPYNPARPSLRGIERLRKRTLGTLHGCQRHGAGFGASAVR